MYVIPGEVRDKGDTVSLVGLRRRVEVVPGQPERQGNNADVIGYPEEWVTVRASVPTH